jgi:hypothetical protein
MQLANASSLSITLFVKLCMGQGVRTPAALTLSCQLVVTQVVGQMVALHLVTLEVWLPWPLAWQPAEGEPTPWPSFLCLCPWLQVKDEAVAIR